MFSNYMMRFDVSFAEIVVVMQKRPIHVCVDVYFVSILFTYDLIAVDIIFLLEFDASSNSVQPLTNFKFSHFYRF